MKGSEIERKQNKHTGGTLGHRKGELRHKVNVLRRWLGEKY